MKIKLTDQFLFFVYENKEEERLKKLFTYEDKSLVFAGGKYDSSKIKRVSFIKSKNSLNWLSSGFLQEFLLACKSLKIKINEIDDERQKLPHQKVDFTDEHLAKHFPFDYNLHQIEALKKLLKVHRGIVKSLTGTGKTEIFFAFLLETQEPALIIVDKVLLCEQLAKRAKDAGVKHVGILHGKKNDTENKKVVFATIGSIKKLPSLTNFRILIIDEVHHASSKRFQEFMKSASYPVQIGFSATPDKDDPYIFAKIRQYLGSVIFETDADTMVENEVIARPKIYFVENEVRPMIDWHSSYVECIIKNPERNRLITDIVEQYKEKVLILIKDVKNKQGQILKDYIATNTTKNVEFIQGSTKDRESVLEWFEKGDLDVLISTNILNEGVSLKEVRILINASGGKSKVENLQKLGRGTRIKDDKKEVIIYDFLDLGNKFTQRHAKDRMRIYKKEGFNDIEIKHSL